VPFSFPVVSHAHCHGALCCRMQFIWKLGIGLWRSDVDHVVNETFTNPDKKKEIDLQLGDNC
jgi:hypothetical protein